MISQPMHFEWPTSASHLSPKPAALKKLQWQSCFWICHGGHLRYPALPSSETCAWKAPPQVLQMSPLGHWGSYFLYKPIDSKD